MSCKAIQQSDEMYCARCDLRWDTNDSDPPKCKPAIDLRAHVIMFPILNDPVIKAIPLAALLPHGKQADKNHGQTFVQLAERGGLCIEEAYFVLKDLPFKQANYQKSKVRIALMRLIENAG